MEGIYPEKNRYYCRACGKKKMLFETKEKAERFIAFNEEFIRARKGVAPTKAYYCKYCDGWHVTKYRNSTYFENKRKAVDIASESFQKFKAESHMTEGERCLSHAQERIFSGDYYAAVLLYVSARDYYFGKGTDLSLVMAEECISMAMDCLKSEVLRTLSAEVMNPKSHENAKYLLEIIKKRLRRHGGKFDGREYELIAMVREIRQRLVQAKLVKKRKASQAKKLESYINHIRIHTRKAEFYISIGYVPEARRHVHKAVRIICTLTAHNYCKASSIPLVDELEKVLLQIID